MALKGSLKRNKREIQLFCLCHTVLCTHSTPQKGSERTKTVRTINNSTHCGSVSHVLPANLLLPHLQSHKARVRTKYTKKRALPKPQRKQEGGREGERETDRQTDRERQTETETETERQTETDRQRQTETETERRWWQSNVNEVMKKARPLTLTLLSAEPVTSRPLCTMIHDTELWCRASVCRHSNVSKLQT